MRSTAYPMAARAPTIQLVAIASFRPSFPRMRRSTANRLFRFADQPSTPCTSATGPPHERPREKLLARGAGALSDAELLAIFLGSGLRGRMRWRRRASCWPTHGPLRALLERSADGAGRRCPASARRAPASWPRRWNWASAISPPDLERGEALTDPQRGRPLFRAAPARTAARGVRGAVPRYPPPRAGVRGTVPRHRRRRRSASARSRAPRAGAQRRGGDRRPQPSQRQRRAQRRRPRRHRAAEAGAGAGRRAPARPLRGRRRRRRCRWRRAAGYERIAQPSQRAPTLLGARARSEGTCGIARDGHRVAVLAGGTDECCGRGRHAGGTDGVGGRALATGHRPHRTRRTCCPATPVRDHPVFFTSRRVRVLRRAGLAAARTMRPSRRPGPSVKSHLRALIAQAIDALRAAGTLPADLATPGLRRRAAEGPRAWRFLDQRRDAAGQAGAQQPARDRAGAGRRAAGERRHRQGRDRRPGLHQLPPRRRRLAARSRARCSRRARAYGRNDSRRGPPRRRRIRLGQSRPARCTSATAAPRRSATASRACSRPTAGT